MTKAFTVFFLFFGISFSLRVHNGYSAQFELP